MGLRYSIEARLNARNTAEGRLYEVRVVLFDCIVIILGSIGLALWFPPLVFAAACGHLIASFLASIVKWIWFLTTAITIGLTSLLFAAATYGVQVYWHDVPSASVIAFLKQSYWNILASATVLNGIVSNLLADGGRVYGP